MAKKRFEDDVEAKERPVRQSAAALMLKRIQSPVEENTQVIPPKPESSADIVGVMNVAPKIDEIEAVDSGASNLTKKRYATALGKKRLIQLGSPEQDEELDDFRRDIKKVSGHNPSVSLLARIGLSIVMRSKQELLSELRDQPSPPWAPARDGKAFSKYEDYWDRVCSRATLRRVDP